MIKGTIGLKDMSELCIYNFWQMNLMCHMFLHPVLGAFQKCKFWSVAQNTKRLLVWYF